MPSDFILQYGPSVPLGSINLSYIGIPSISSEENASVIATAKWIPSNAFTESEIIIDNYSGSISLPETYNISSSSVSIDKNQDGEKLFNFIHQPIEIINPIEDSTGAWRLQVANGSFIRIISLGDNEGSFSWLKIPAASGGPEYQAGDVLVLFYSIPEFCLAPYYDTTNRLVQVLHESASILDNNKFSVSNKFISSITRVVTAGGLVLYGLDDPTQSEGATLGDGSINTMHDEIVIDNTINSVIRTKIDGIQPSNINYNNFGRSLSPDEDIFVDYIYEGQYYSYLGYCDDQGVYHSLDLNPSHGHFIDKASSPVESQELLTDTVYLYLLPTAAMKIGVLDTDGTIKSSPSDSFSIKSLMPLKLFPLRWQTKQRGNPNGEFYVAPLASYFGYAHLDKSQFSARDFVENKITGGGMNGLDNTAVLLAEVVVGPNATVDSVQVIDTRTRGGGVPELNAEFQRNYTQVANKRITEIDGYWDISTWDGIPVMLDGVVIVEIPKDVRDGTNGYPKIEESDIRAAIEKNIASGVLYIIQWID